MLQAGTNVTFVAGDVPRLAQMALWPRVTRQSDRVALVLPRGPGPVVVDVDATLVPLATLLDELLALPADARMTPSAHAWAIAARLAVGLIARGRIRPGVAGEVDVWRCGPLDNAELLARRALADWMPPESSSVAIHGQQPPRVVAPIVALAGFYDAVADVIPRTAAATIVSRQLPFATPHLIEDPALAELVGDDHDRAILGVRLQIPTDDDQPFRAQLQIRSATDPSVVADAADLWAGCAIGFDHIAEADLLVALRRGARLWEPFAALLDEPTPASIELDDRHASELLGPVAEQLAAIGIEVLVPFAATRSIRAAAHVEPPPGAGDGPAAFDLSSLCQLTYRPTLDGAPLTTAELSALAAASRPLVRLRDEWVLVDPAVLAKLRRSVTVTGGEALAAALSGEIHLDGDVVEVDPAPALLQFADTLRNAATPHELDPPDELAATLRPYQRRGLGWLNEMAGLGLGGVLADDMGLGKTVQFIALHLLRARHAARAPQPTLVICPASVVTNWEHEFARFAPEVELHRYHGSDRTLRGVAGPMVVVTTYGIVRRDQSLLAELPWGLIAADEAQHIKNPNAAVSRALRGIPAAARIALTGTPVENRLTELWALLDWTTPGLLGSVEKFRRDVALPIERGADDDTLERFRRVVAPFVLRRRKVDPDVAPDLPPKIETDHLVTITQEQASLYRAVVEESLVAIEQAEGIARRGLVLKLLTALKQICNHPAHYLGQPGPLAGRSAKLDLLEELLGAITDAGDSVLVFTQYVAMGHLLCARLAEVGLAHDFLHGSQGLSARSRMVERFQAGEFPVFVVSLKAGGTGLNLTRATHVVHYDRWWNPAVEAQASDRAWRIGQTRSVQVHRPISEGTVEERIATILAQKAALADSVIGAGEAWISELSDSELAELVRLGGD